MNWNQFKKNLPTTISALIGVAGGFIALHPAHFPTILQEIAQYIALGGLAALGVTAKSAGTTGVGDSAK